ncbi:MAG: carbon storage regulator [Planctomycetales bacterium]|nr:carbon storage regulator [Planctomycetales bacterium]
MLVLSRKKSEAIQLGDSIQVTVIKVSGDKVRIGIQAPADMLILRRELTPEEAAAIAKPTDKNVDIRAA